MSEVIRDPRRSDHKLTLKIHLFLMGLNPPTYPWTSKYLLRFGVLGMFLGSKYLLTRCLSGSVGYNNDNHHFFHSHGSVKIGPSNVNSHFLNTAIFPLNHDSRRKSKPHPGSQADY